MDVLIDSNADTKDRKLFTVILKKPEVFGFFYARKINEQLRPMDELQTAFITSIENVKMNDCFKP